MASATSITSNASSGKRKRNSPKFYAVKVGRTPGIYHSWEDCKAQTDGMRAQYKSFSTLTEAEAFIKGTSASSTANAAKPTKFYGVAIGHVPGIYTHYSTVQAQVKGFPGAKQKGFATREEAQAYVSSFKRDSSAPISLREDPSETSSLLAANAAKVGDGAGTTKRQKKSGAPILTNGELNFEPGTGPLPLGAEDGFDPTILLDPDTGNIRAKTVPELGLTKSQPTGDFSGPIDVYTDGSSLGNGQLGALGGVGVYFGPNDPRNISEPLRGERQTNQRAELTAVARALDHVPIDRHVVIHTDSKYSINCLTEWFQKWEQNGWKSSSGKSVDNKDLIEPIISRIRERDMCRAKTKFNWVKGHASDPGNVAADYLAVQGSRNSTPDFRSAPQTSSTLTGSKIPNTESEAEEAKFAFQTVVPNSHDAAQKSGGRRHDADLATAPILDQHDNTVDATEDDEDAAVFECIFADLAAEQSAKGNVVDPMSHEQTPTTIVHTQGSSNNDTNNERHQLLSVPAGEKQVSIDTEAVDGTHVVQKKTKSV